MSEFLASNDWQAVKGLKAVAKGLSKGTANKFIVVALGRDGKVVSTSKVVHAYTKGGEYGNPRSVAMPKKAKAKAKRGKVTVK